MVPPPWQGGDSCPPMGELSINLVEEELYDCGVDRGVLEGVVALLMERSHLHHDESNIQCK